ncbi:MAG: VOC family protein [Acidimicrobiia bacterium]|nr:VOC family protein [Acidimicrobiia bacterium]
MAIRGIHHVSLNVHDTEEAGRFYLDVLGFRPLDRPAFGFPGMWLETPDGRQVHLIEVEDHEAPDGQHFALLVDDIDATVAELRGRGAEVGDPYPVGAGRQAFFHDPAGNLIELNCPGG